jgi:hypothetical protein
MIRTTLGALGGMIAGVGVTALLLTLTRIILAWKTAPQVFEIEHGVVYLAVILGGGFGGLSGALAGLAGILLRTARQRSE